MNNRYQWLARSEWMPHPSAAEQPYAINVSGPSSGTRSVPLSVRAFFTASLKFMNTSTMTHLTRWDRAFIGNAPENRGRFGDGSGTAADAGRSLAAKRGRAHRVEGWMSGFTQRRNLIGEPKRLRVYCIMIMRTMMMMMTTLTQAAFFLSILL